MKTTNSEPGLPFPPHALEVIALRSLDDIGGYCSCVKDSPRWDKYNSLEERGWVTLKWCEGVSAYQVQITKAGREAMATPDDQIRI